MNEPAYDAALDPEVPDDDLNTDELARRRSANQSAAERRIESKRVRELEAENADLKGKLGGYERQEALAAAKRDLNFEGPLDAFLRANPTVDPTADAIQKAVESDPDFKALITFTPDERDAAAAIQARDAKNLAGGGSHPSELKAADVHAWPMERKESFRESHPDAWKALMSTGTVTAPAGWA